MSMAIFSLYFPILLSVSLSFVLHAFINLFKKHMFRCFFGLVGSGTLNANPTDNYKLHLLQCHRPISSIVGGSALIAATGPPNVLATESATTVKPAPPPPSPSPQTQRDPGGIGFIDNVGDGLISCTESLGFESSDERRIVDQIDAIDDNAKKNNDKDDDDDGDDDGCWRTMRAAECRGNWRNVGNWYRKKEAKSFPPPLSSLNMNGQPSFFLRPVRKNGRLELTEVRIQRSEILHASRQDGRLRLHLIPDQSILDDAEEEEDEWEEEEQELVEEAIVETEEEEEEEDDEVVEEIRYEKEEERAGEWKFQPMGGSERYRRCHEVLKHHHHVHGIGSHHHRHHHHLHHHLPMCGVSIA